MTPSSTDVRDPALDPQEAAPAAPSATRPLYWSIRRELWENRSVYIGPLGVGTFAVVGLVIHAITMPSHLPGMLAMEPENRGSAATVYILGAALMLVTAFVIGAFYCLEALNSERRDRSILFWKSLPVSDLTTVLAKASIPLVVLPLLTLAVIVAMQLSMLLLSVAALLTHGESAVALLREVQPFRMWLTLPYTVAVMALWHAPIYASLLFISAWARRTAAVWAVLPLLAAGVLEKLTFDTWHVAAWVRYRLIGWHQEAFAAPAEGGLALGALTSATPGKLLSTPGLWIGLAAAAVFLAAAVRLRREREPV